MKSEVIFLFYIQSFIYWVKNSCKIFYLHYYKRWIFYIINSLIYLLYVYHPYTFYFFLVVIMVVVKFVFLYSKTLNNYLVKIFPFTKKLLPTVCKEICYSIYKAILLFPRTVYTEDMVYFPNVRLLPAIYKTILCYSHLQFTN